jgi:O-antigen ligase
MALGFGALPLLWFLSAAVIALSLMLGGGTRQGLWSDAVVQLASLVLLANVLLRMLRERRSPAGLSPLIIVAAVVLLPVLQLAPLPSTLWTLLSGREAIAAAYRDAGITMPWLQVSLDPGATWQSVLSLLPPVAVFLAVARLDLAARRGLSLVFIAFGVVSVLIGLAQLMQGPGSPLRFYPITNPSNSVGFFANRNHYAALLYSLIPFTAAWVVGLAFDRRAERLLGLAVCFLVYAALLLGLGMAQSRAGVALAAIAAFGSLLLAGINGRRFAKRGLAVILGASLVGAILIVQFAFFDLIGRFDNGVLTDFRFRIADITVGAARAFQPFGSGFGTFEAVYRMFEVPDALLATYVNHAHNDWLEVWLVGGWPGLAVALGFLGWFAGAVSKAWRADVRDSGTLDRALAQAGTIVIVLILLHSALDYPLRTTALMVLVAFSCGLLIRPAGLREPTRQGDMTIARRNSAAVLSVHLSPSFAASPARRRNATASVRRTNRQS